jgi:hypothetical protein
MAEVRIISKAMILRSDSQEHDWYVIAISILVKNCGREVGIMRASDFNQMVLKLFLIQCLCWGYTTLEGT